MKIEQIIILFYELIHMLNVISLMSLWPYSDQLNREQIIIFLILEKLSVLFLEQNF
jgi:hypothetical protein